MAEDSKEKKILEGALKLFVEKGIDNTSTSLISKEAGVATGTLYLYFENKEDLVNKVYILIFKEIVDLIGLDSSKSYLSFDYLEKSWLGRVEWGINNVYKYKFILQFRSSPYFTGNIKELFIEQEKNLIRLIKGSIKNKKFKDLPPDYILGLILTHFTYTVDYIIQTKTNERKIFFKTLVDGIKSDK